jgi:polysaccharide export outer membrane protein
MSPINRLAVFSWLAGTACWGIAADSVQNGGLKLSQAELTRRFEQTSEGEYTLGAGDEIDVQVPTNPDLQGHHVVGPDGRITIPIYGSILVGGKTREEAANEITKAFDQFYTEVHAVVQVTKYGSNRVVIVGRVATPGPVYFDTSPTLLEALAKSGAYSQQTTTTTLNSSSPGALPRVNRCAIYRGSEEVLWIDLKQLFASGTSAVDIRLRRGDVVYVPDEQEEQVSVLGQVRNPGAVKLGQNTRLVDVLALAGGLTDDADNKRIRLVRPSTGLARDIAFRDLVKPNGSADSADIALRNGDVIYVPSSTLSKVGYALQKLSPASTVLSFGALAVGH